ncbi:MAG: NAD(P)/FAD-dependent oxidoreductase [Nitrososphaerales archaeon]
MDHDVIVAGGGMAGLITAASVAKHSKQKLDILVVDRNSRPEAGKKTINGWICGDAVSKRSVDNIAKEIGIKYGKPELEHPVKGVVAYSPNHESKVMFEGEGYVLNRRLLPLRQVADAEKLGVRFEFGVLIERLQHDNGFVKGVEGSYVKDRKPFKKSSKIVIDSSGSASKLRANLPIKSYIQKEIDKDNDLESTGRYILEFERGKKDDTYFDPDYAIIHLDQILAPGGYAWVFPKGQNKVNIGLGVQHRWLVARNRKIGKNDNLQSLIDQYIEGNPVIKKHRYPAGEDDAGNVKGNWQVPVRRQNDCLVANGYIIIGDAAWMPRPIDAGGIGPSIVASIIAGRTVAQALEGSDTSQESLWSYNVEYMKSYGYQMASFEVLRRYLQTITNEEIDFGMKHFLSQDDVDKITEREHPGFNKVRMLDPLMWLRILSRYSLASSLRYTAKKSERLIEHGQNFPESPKEFPAWHKVHMSELGEAYERFSKT